MEWDKEKDYEYMKELWNSRKSSGMSHKKEDWDKRAVGWEEGLETDEEKNNRSNKRIKAMADFLIAEGALNKSADVIDIGCGPGRFVAEFAKSAKSVLGVDISSAMCDYGKKFAQFQGLDNVDFFTCNFKDLDVKDAGWENKFDLVFSSITPAMSTYDSLQKSLVMSRNYCFQANYVRTCDEIFERVLGQIMPDVLEKMKRDIRSTYVLVNLLWLSGYFPKVSYYNEISDREQVLSEALVEDVLKMVPDIYKTDLVKKQVYDLLARETDENGIIKRHVEWTYSMVLWNVRK